MIPCMIENLHAVYRYAGETGDDSYRINAVKAFNHRGEPMVFDVVQSRLVLAGAEMLDENETFVGVWVINPDELLETDDDGVVE